jgi:hypothetical protein
MRTAALSQGVKWPKRVAEYLPPTSAEIKKMWIYTCTTPYAKSNSKLSCDRRSVGQSVLVSGHIRTRDQFFFLLEIFFRQLRVYYFVAPSLTRGRVCNLLLLLDLASPIPLGSESRGTKDHILLSQFLRLPKPGEPGPRIYIPQEQRGPDTRIPPGTFMALCLNSYAQGRICLAKIWPVLRNVNVRITDNAQ